MSDHLIDDSHLPETREWFAKCQEVIAGGESSYARLTGTRPIVMSHGDGAHFYDVDGNRYIDWCLGYGPMIFGHRPRFIVDAIAEQITQRGMLYTFPHELDWEVGRKIVQAVPGIDQVRFANSGSEATQAAMRLARGYTGKEKILKWEGSYNGFLDCHAFSHMPDLETAGLEKYPRTLPSGAGIPKAVEDTVVVGCFNDLESVEELMRRHGHELAAVLAEPILADCGIIPPEPGFLEGLRRLCDEYGVLLIFDEIITGFRVALGGAQERYGVIPDITCVAKAVGGGTPGAAAFGAKKHIMDIETENVVLHGGTYSANPMTLAGMNAALDKLLGETDAVYGRLNGTADAMVAGMRAIFAEQGVPAHIGHVGPMWQVFFGQEAPVTRARQARTSDTRFFSHWQAECQARGVYFHNYNFERFFASTAHTQEDVDESLAVMETATRIVKERLGSLPEGV
ncbi:MAG TPA: aspartate aminotransferase family protein [Thermoleophilia bacterium]|nr:aspartate aminotransferase family protein [Thermoleophilia bacterium]